MAHTLVFILSSEEAPLFHILITYMPKLIDYPRTNYAGAWEVSDVVDDTGGKCALETCARKLNKKVSGSFKAIIGSAVKFGLLTSKREMLTTTTLFRRIKHAYDKQEELIFHREAFLTPPLFTQLCRKFRSRELPVQMLDIMLIREFDVEEINAQGVAKAFIDGARMVGLLDERHIIADIDQLAAQQPPRRELASPELSANSFRAEVARANAQADLSTAKQLFSSSETDEVKGEIRAAVEPRTTETATSYSNSPIRGRDAVASLFGIAETKETSTSKQDIIQKPDLNIPDKQPAAHQAAMQVQKSAPQRSLQTELPAANQIQPSMQPVSAQAISTPTGTTNTLGPTASNTSLKGFRIQLSGPGLDTVLDVQDEDDLALARFLLDKIGRQLRK